MILSGGGGRESTGNQGPAQWASGVNYEWCEVKLAIYPAVIFSSSEAGHAHGEDRQGRGGVPTIKHT